MSCLRGLPDAFALGALALELAGASDRGRAFAGTLLARLLIVAAQLHLAVDAFPLQLLFERAQRLLDIIVANDDLHRIPSQSLLRKATALLAIASGLQRNSSAARGL